jgi:hypothetical protein
MEFPAGWTCERTARQFENYLRSILELVDCLAVAEHLEACSGCAQSIVMYRLSVVDRRRG